MALDQTANFCYGTVLVAPSPATSGTSMQVTLLGGCTLPTAPWNAAVWVLGSGGLESNAEIIRVTSFSMAGVVATLTIVRAQEDTTAQTIIVGDQFGVMPTAKLVADLNAILVPFAADQAGLVSDPGTPSGKFLRDDNTFQTIAGSGTVTTVSVATANGFSGTVTNPTTTPAITIVAGAITPTSVNSVVISGSATPTLAVSGTTAVSGANTGDQTSVTGNAGTATALQTARTINGVSFNGTADITVLPNVTDDVQTKNAIVPNTAPSAGEILIGNAGGTAYAKNAVSGDAAISSAGALTLATVNGNVGSFTSANITVDAKGRITAAANGSGGAADMLSVLTAPEIAITNAGTTLTIGRMHALKATSGNQTNALPAVSGNTGKFIGIRITSDTTELVTIDGDGSETIDGASTRVMWALETAILMCDGTGWAKVAGRSIPMIATLTLSADQTGVAENTNTKVLLDTATTDSVGMCDTGNNRIAIYRTGRYRISPAPRYGGAAANLGITTDVARLTGWSRLNGGTSINYSNVEVSALESSYPKFVAPTFVNAVAGDYFDMWVYWYAGGGGGNLTIEGGLGVENTHFEVEEVCVW